MASVYTVRFFGGRVDTSGLVNLYEVPAGKVAIVRDVAAFKRAGTDISAWAFGHRATAAGNFTAQVGGAPIVSRGDSIREYRQVFEPGEFMAAQIGASNTYNMWVTGYLFDLL